MQVIFKHKWFGPKGIRYRARPAPYDLPDEWRKIIPSSAEVVGEQEPEAAPEPEKELEKEPETAPGLPEPDPVTAEFKRQLKEAVGHDVAGASAAATTVAAKAAKLKSAGKKK